MSASNVLRLRDCERALKELRRLANRDTWNEAPLLFRDELRAILATVPE